jgi:hypothetical protein
MAVSPSPETAVTAFADKLIEIEIRLTRLPIWRAISTYRAAAKARTELDELTRQYYETIQVFRNALRSGVSGPGFAVAHAAVEATAAGLSSILLVQQRWASVNGLVDRKQTLALGVIGLLIAVIALVVSVIPLLAQ